MLLRCLDDPKLHHDFLQPMDPRPSKISYVVFKSRAANDEIKLALSSLPDVLPSHLRDRHDPNRCSDNPFSRWTAFCADDARPVAASYRTHWCTVQPQLSL